MLEAILRPQKEGTLTWENVLRLSEDLIERDLEVHTEMYTARGRIEKIEILHGVVYIYLKWTAYKSQLNWRTPKEWFKWKTEIYKVNYDSQPSVLENGRLEFHVQSGNSGYILPIGDNLDPNDVEGLEID